MKPKPIGYSGTPLAKKLGITSGARVLAVDAPDDYPDLLAPLPEGVMFEKRLSRRVRSNRDLVGLEIGHPEGIALKPWRTRASRRCLGGV